jgi:hypothetical protein
LDYKPLLCFPYRRLGNIWEQNTLQILDRTVMSLWKRACRR